MSKTLPTPVAKQFLNSPNLPYLSKQPVKPRTVPKERAISRMCPLMTCYVVVAGVVGRYLTHVAVSGGAAECAVVVIAQCAHSVKYSCALIAELTVLATVRAG